jgi:iron complex transport system permease protein
VKAIYRKRLWGRVLILALLLVVLILSLGAALGIGSVPIRSGEILAVVLPGGDAGSELARNILLTLRMPRALLGALVGAALALAGAAMQGMFRNPLADPGLIGVSAGATLGAVLSIVFLGGLAAQLGPWVLRWITPFSAFLFALGTTWFIYGVSQRRGRVQVATMLLAGVAVNAMAGAFIGYALFRAGNEQLRNVTFWTLGSLSQAGWGEVRLILGPVLLGLVALTFYGKQLNALLLGEAEAARLGFRVERGKKVLIALAALIVGAAVAVSGTIGFLGLVVPHLVRMILGPDHRFLLPGSALLGAALLVLADLLARTLVSPSELPLGMITACLGGPFFLYLLLRNRHYLA